MRYTDLIFDLYGTLVDIHTEENPEVWEKTALYFSYHGAKFDGTSLHDAFSKAMKDRSAKEGQQYECFPDIPFEEILEELFICAGVTNQASQLALEASKLFRICSTEYIRLYPGVKAALSQLRSRGYRLWLLSNAQRSFTEYELVHLELSPYFDGIYLSSDYRCRKPDFRFFQALIQDRDLIPERCLMIGNDRDTDIAGAKAVGFHTLYMHTDLTPADQAPANPLLLPGDGSPEICHYEFEGDDWSKLSEILRSLCP